MRAGPGFWLVLALVAWSAPARAQALADRLGALAGEAVSGDRVTGIVLGVELAGSAPAVAAAGLADISSGVAMAADSRFKAASIVKTFIAALALKLEEEHRLALDDRLAALVPDIPSAGRVTLRQLLSHSSGYDDYHTDALIAAARKAPGKIWSLRELIRYARPDHLRFAPGTRYDYSNTNYLLLGLALAAAGGEPVSDAIRRRFLEPLHLADSWIGAPDAVPLERLAHGYADTDDTGAKRDVTDQNLVTGGADGVLLSTVPNLMAWCRALFERRVLAKAQLAEMLTFATPPGDEPVPGVGYGLGVEMFRIDGVEFLGHTGSRVGYESVMLYQPATRAVIVIALNEDPADEALLDILMERVVKAVEASGALRLPKVPDPEAQAPKP
jgi:D-alanyl-D-alanine carboxypeptidase